MAKQPLAFRLRPKHIGEIIGQKHLVGEGKMIERMVSAKRLASMILFGPPGTGKTSMAIALAKSIGLRYKILNAVIDKKKDMEIAVEEAKMFGSLVIILDEVHRLDKAKQDFLLPHLESNLITLIGCTTSNPYHSINPAIRSRVHLFELNKLSVTEVQEALTRAINDKDEGLGNMKIKITDEALEHFANASGGDLRAALNGLELAAFSTKKSADDTIVIDLSVAEACMQKKSFNHDKGGDAHYDVLSAFQKSIRGSDVNAALHYLARLIEAGDLDSIARRMTVIAYEDIGLANPSAGMRTLAAIEAAERVGFPEARIPLSVALVELCLSPKSNSAYKALDQAIYDVRNSDIGDIPPHLKDSHYYGASKLGRGIGYKYPHDYPGAWVKQDYLPEPLRNKKYYQPVETGKFERALKQIYDQINNYE
ncbi:replication-associated recombination protein A [Amphibacillus xylanus]|uniref:Replication-associated recombination protein A n=1 Tax=Amphibacillus xylanus (strain ATCC 51415 / DSM 6626 / JCM 7361 / LMG 17667 / NBRC 15112 / Ep01) TaxID=698758 RepID=K0IXR6_AMPXN|nr:replication-associated recombination protein A [Amphibacillus xylanus]BAM47189.1 putative ATPase [Amphibacillus xylanus NBRC 15112]